MHRLVRALTVLVTALLLFGGLRVQPTAAQSSNGITGDTSYESPTFGYTVEWQDPWYVLEELIIVSETGDALALWSDEHDARIDVGSYFARNRTAQAFLDAYLDLIRESHPDLKRVATVTGTPANPAYLVTYLHSSTDGMIDHYLEAQKVGDAIVVIEVRGGERQGLKLASTVAADVTLNGDAILGSIESSNGQGEESSTGNGGNNGNSKTDRPVSEEDESNTSNLETYESPTFGSTFQYDADLWTVSDEWTADKNDGRDLVILESGIPAVLYVEHYDDYNGRAAACIDAAAGEAVGDIDQADLLQDEHGDDIEGSSTGKAWVAYAFEGNSGNPLAGYIECRSLPESAGVFVFTLISNEDDFVDAYAAGLDILDTVNVDGAMGKTDSSNAAGTSGSYESPTHGYVLNYDAADWSVISDSSRETTDQLILSGPDNATLYVQGMKAGLGSSARACVKSATGIFEESQDFELFQIVSTTGEPLAGDNDFGHYAGFEFTDGNGDTFALYVECGASPDEEVYVLFLAFAPKQDLRPMLNNVSDLIDGLEF